MNGLNEVDLVIVTVVAISSIVALFRGFLTEIISLAVWIGAFWAASLFSDQVAIELAPHIDAAPIRAVAAFGLVFLATLFAGGLVNIFVTFLVRRAKISGPDRLLGLAFGFARGVLALSVLIMLLAVTPLTKHAYWQESVFIPSLTVVANQLKIFLPQQLLAQMDFKSMLEKVTPELAQPALQEAIAPSSPPLPIQLQSPTTAPSP